LKNDFGNVWLFNEEEPPKETIKIPIQKKADGTWGF